MIEDTVKDERVASHAQDQSDDHVLLARLGAAVAKLVVGKGRRPDSSGYTINISTWPVGIGQDGLTFDQLVKVLDAAFEPANFENALESLAPPGKTSKIDREDLGVTEIE
jgi:hypothetical protein